jgi:hypothetical protein
MDVPYSFPEDNVVRMFEPDLITPEQHRDRVSSELVDQPEVRLMLAVMEDAVATYQRYAMDPGRRARRLFEEAQAWIASDDTSWPYSFENICHALRFNPDSIRRGLEEWRAERQNDKGHVYRFPFRRVNGRRHSISLRDRHLRQSA